MNHPSSSSLSLSEMARFIPNHLSTHLNSYQQGYFQALSDFGVDHLLLHLSHSPASLKPQEAETLTNLFVQQITDCIDEELITANLEALRQGDDFLSVSLSWEDHAKFGLFDEFPQIIPQPQFQLGDRLKYTQLNENDPIDRGQVIGFYFCYAPQYRRWMWRYVLWLAENSPSSAWLNATVVWESDLELQEQEHGT